MKDQTAGLAYTEIAVATNWVDWCVLAVLVKEFLDQQEFRW